MNATEYLELEKRALRAWPALEDVEYDGWRLRAAQGYTGRANSVAPLQHHGLPLEDKIAHCEAWYAARHLPPKFRLTAFSQPDGLDAFLEARGYRHMDPVATLTLRLPPDTESSPAAGEATDLSVEDWFAGKTGPAAAIQRALIERIRPARWLMGWQRDGVTAARVLGVVDDGWIGIFNLSVDEPLRRQGLGRALMTALLQRAVRHGVQNAYLQVVEDNAAAVGLYTGLGFRAAYRYGYRVREGPKEPPSVS